MADQPQPPNTRQSGPQAHKAPKDPVHAIPQGGPMAEHLAVLEEHRNVQGAHRGVEPNTASHRGTPNPDQHGTPGHIGGADHDPGKGQAGMTHQGPHHAPPVVGRTAEHSEKQGPPEPNPKGVRK